MKVSPKNIIANNKISFNYPIWLILVISILSSSSCAAWKYVGTDQDGPIYIETTSIKKEKGFVFYKMLSDYIKAGRSSVSLVQADCSSKRIKLLQAKAYLQLMARGPYQTHKPVPRWVSASNNKVIEVVLPFVCQ